MNTSIPGRLRGAVFAAAVAFGCAFSPSAHALDHPPTVTPAGAAPIPLAAHATRLYRLGLSEIYSVAIYIDTPIVDRARLLSPETAKALRIEVAHKDDVRRLVALDWHHELVPRLDPAAAAHLRGTFAPLMHGDVVIIDYAPGKGTAVRVNRAVAVTGASHELMLAFLDHWLGQRPVSEEMKRALLGSS